MNSDTNTCKNMFLEADGFCCECGRNHWKNERKSSAARKDHSAAQLQAQSRSELISVQITENPVYQTARETINLLLETYGLTCRVIFRNRQSSCFFAQLSHGQELDRHFCFGYQNLNYYYENGFVEYKSLRWMVRGQPEGLEAVKWVAAHEFAHFLAYHRYGHVQSHGAEFIRCYAEIIKLLF